MKTFRRKIYSKLLEWKAESAGNTALLIKGARRIGKSTIVSEFAKNEYKSYILVDFYYAKKEVKDLFHDISDLDGFFRMLQFYYNVELFNRESVIIFDEVQLFPLARQAIKALVKDHRYDYIETGSLVSIRRNTEGILIPSEERSIEMYPMDYEEFCWATGKTNSYELGREMFMSMKSYGNDVNRSLMRDFRLYMLVGGMPQAVSAFLETNNFSRVDAVKRDILELYDNDFMKIDPTGVHSLLYSQIPAQLSSNASRYKVSSVFPNKRARVMLECITNLKDSMTSVVAYHALSPEVGLSQSIDLECFKLFICDVGLFVTLCFKDRDFTENRIYEKLLSDKLDSNLGYVYENVVAQMLKAKGDNLFYHTFKSESSNHNYEVDFIVQRESKICPLEVKSSKYSTHTSLDIFQEKFSSKVKNRYIIHTKELRKDGDIICIPFYMVPFL